MITVFLPCRKGSQRIPYKNTKDFAGIKGGLLHIKLKQLVALKEVDNIVISSNDDYVLDFSSKINDSRIRLDERPDYLASNGTTTDELIQYVPSIIKEGDVLWTHVTSPFINSDDYRSFISTYRDKIKEGYDSLMTVQKIQGFVWDANTPINYDKSELKWPFTQNINPIFEVDSGAFISSIENYNSMKDRIGLKPFFYLQSKEKSLDIDWPEDFIFAERFWLSRGRCG